MSGNDKDMPAEAPVRADVTRAMKAIDLCMMVTHGDGGQMTSRPMSNNRQVDFDGDVYFFSFRDTRKVAQIGRDPSVTLDYQDAPIWLSLRGRAEIVDDVAQKKARWTSDLDTWFPDGPEDDNVVLIHVHADEAEFWGRLEGIVTL